MRSCPPSLLLAMAAFPAACHAPIGVEPTGFVPIYEELRRNVLDEGTVPSPRTWQLLAYFDLDRRYRDDPAGAIAALEEIALRERYRPMHVGLAELHYDQAVARHGDPGHFIAAVLHAYTYLFDPDFPEKPNPYSPRFRLACDLYNRGLARALQGPTGAVLVQDALLETPLGRIAVEAIRPGFPWGPESFSTFLPSDAYAVRGLRERVREHGLGVPLIAVRDADAQDALASRHFAREIKLPATAFLRLRGSLADLERTGTLDAALELYLDLDVPTIEVADRPVALEADLTAPLAYGLEGSPIWRFELSGFLSGETQAFAPGVYLWQPYQPGKIPLLLVHGTYSSPATWAQTVNGLVADPRIRSEYQIWLALYNTGNPILYSAMQVRESLVDLVRELDPEGDDPALRRMVAVGHSQGGLVTRLLVTESGERVWDAVFDSPPEELEMAEDVRDLLQRALYFEPVPFIERAVFIATPHRGSFFAETWLGRLGARLVTLPRRLSELPGKVLRDGEVPREWRKVHTSVEQMDPDSTFVEVLASLPWKAGLAIHTIAAVKPHFATLEEGNDGVVAYESAHLEQAESEVVVRAEHSCQGEPATIGERRRILARHMNDGPAAEASDERAAQR